MSKQTDPSHDQKPNVFQIIFSIAAAAFGVQSNRNRKRDFTGGSIYTYMAAGAIFTVIFILLMVLTVRVVLSSAGI